MKQLLGDEYDRFLESLQEEQTYGLRLNSLKVTSKQWKKLNPFTLEAIPWATQGFYYDEKERPGKHPYHDAGLYYIQEPSAMAVVEAMQAEPGEKILDLAAAPGGKATHIAQYLQGEGLLVANDIHPKRARALSQNIERLGITNAVVTNERPDGLAKHFPKFFDRILLDAPCSGEGMFRKDIDAINHWSLENVATCASRQLHILEDAKRMLRPGGQLVYSTCTFAPEENEQVINDFLRENPEFELEAVPLKEHFQRGRSEWVNDPVVSIDQTVRIWPHHVRGEGHFIAILRKNDRVKVSEQQLRPVRGVKNKKRLAYFYDFVEEFLVDLPHGELVFFGNELYAVPKGMVSLDRLKVLRAGLHLGTNKKNRFEPSHALALALNQEQAKFVWDLRVNDREIYAYLKGETFPATGEAGWYLITVDGFSIGWGKLVQQTMKNHYPKGLRWLGV